jgi:hypothetical protein
MRGVKAQQETPSKREPLGKGAALCLTEVRWLRLTLVGQMFNLSVAREGQIDLPREGPTVAPVRAPELNSSVTATPRISSRTRVGWSDYQAECGAGPAWIRSKKRAPTARVIGGMGWRSGPLPLWGERQSDVAVSDIRLQLDLQLIMKM